mgnify:CR=1 FL=1
MHGDATVLHEQELDDCGVNTVLVETGRQWARQRGVLVESGEQRGGGRKEQERERRQQYVPDVNTNTPPKYLDVSRPLKMFGSDPICRALNSLKTFFKV